MKLLWGIIRALRPRQWIKNFALFAGLIFSGKLDSISAFLIVCGAFIIFSGVASAIYLLNDVFDIDRDKQHPFKSLRPIAAGIVSPKLAVGLAFLLILAALPLAYILSPALFYATLAYLVLQIFYSAYLKSVILLDVMVIAAGFVLRVYAGIWAIDAHLNVWFLLTIITFSLFLAIGKRRSELTLLTNQAAGKHRETLLHYPENLLDILTAMFANSTWLTYALFAFQQPPILLRSTILDLFFRTPSPYDPGVKYLMATVPVAIYGVMRYLYIIYEKREGESPEKVILTDLPLLISAVLWLTMVIFIVYYLGG
ncbi:UbiA prenyltransferase family protein [Patescibacteria group bacterium]|nr:UbiA prenyltransferase family protein [Patescibacteria group bacterium]MCL5410223.1 UbiA prenyltransferase family protein [Patescibacteria group bacterium]